MVRFKKIELSGGAEQVADLSRVGSLLVTPDKLFYLDIDDDYIHRLFPLFHSLYPGVVKAQKSIGAHISVVYPEENCLLPEDELEKHHAFEIRGAFSADLGAKRYYGLAVHSPDLIALRKKNKLSEKLHFKGQLIELHITVGTEILF
ncbi:MAG: hypothetical protein Q8M03_16290 [Legionella sp.]|nr:hypothetical protein [Legionella sp.]